MITNSEKIMQDIIERFEYLSETGSFWLHSNTLDYVVVPRYQHTSVGSLNLLGISRIDIADAISRGGGYDLAYDAGYIHCYISMDKLYMYATIRFEDTLSNKVKRKLKEIAEMLNVPNIIICDDKTAARQVLLGIDEEFT